MSAKALISRGGRAVVHDGDDYYLLTVDTDEPKEVTPSHWTHMQALERGTVSTWNADRYPFVAIRRRMIATYREQLATDLLLICVDDDHDEAFRRETCAVLEKLLMEERWLVDRLLSLVRGVADMSRSVRGRGALPRDTGALDMAVGAGALHVADIIDAMRPKGREEAP